ncbi:MAG: toll/interleukin-1 receptor domain-containing protein [Clostridia bacterium]|nr:toll/interleukin-1 receptor domain-containing protein [Clostridia bacterium]
MSMLEQILPCNLNKPYIFISYSSKDRERVLEDVLEFQRRGYNLWLDDRNLDKTNPSWKVDALKAIESYYCKLVVFYVSRWSLTSDNCYEELCHTRCKKTVAYHNEEVKYIAVELESIGNITTYKNDVFDELMEDETVSLKERQMRAEVLYDFINDFFNTNNEKVRVHPRDEANRIIDYYTDVTAAFPDKTKIRKSTRTAAPEPKVPVPAEPVPPKPVPGQTAPPIPEIFEKYDPKPEVPPEQLYEKAQTYYDAKDYEEAVKWYRKAAVLGHVKAQNNLGWCFENGYGTEKDYTEAAKWYLRAAEQGDASAQCSLGWYYQYGKGVSQDNTEAVKWYRKAAEQGNASAQCSLGEFYQYGSCVPKDTDEAVKWYRKAAEQGNERAKRALTFLELQPYI